MNERVGVCFKLFATVESLLAHPAKLALAVFPCVLHPLEPNVARIVGEVFGDGVRAISVL